MLQTPQTLPPAWTSSPGEVHQAEWRARVELAACYRVCHHLGWTDLIYTHISASVPDTADEFLINPFGLAFDEVRASNLVRIDLRGTKLDANPYTVNEAGFLIHGAIHEARPDAHCVLHLHTEAGMAVSMLEHGLDTRLSQHAARFHDRVAFHDFEGIALDVDEKARLVADLGDRRVMILRNHGFLTVGRSIGEAFVLMFYLEKAARAQLLAAGHDRVVGMDIEVAAHTRDQFGDEHRIAGNAEWASMRRLVERLYPEHAN